MKRHASYYVKHPRRASLHNYRYVKKAAEKYRREVERTKISWQEYWHALFGLAVCKESSWVGAQLFGKGFSNQWVGKVRVGRYSMRRREGIMWDMQWVGRHSIQCGVEKRTSINECVCVPLCARLASKSFRRDVTVSLRPSLAIRTQTSTSTRTGSETEPADASLHHAQFCPGYGTINVSVQKPNLLMSLQRDCRSLLDDENTYSTTMPIFWSCLPFIYFLIIVNDCISSFVIITSKQMLWMIQILNEFNRGDTPGIQISNNHTATHCHS